MVSKDQVRTERQPSPAEDSGQTVARAEAGILTKHQDAHVPGHDTRVEQAEARTEQAEARTEQARTRTEQAETRTEEAEARTEQANTRTEQAEKRSEQTIRASEFNYRRLFEAAREGILILEADTGRISDVNPFLIEMLGFSHDDLVGTRIWELGAFRDIVSNTARFEQLKQQGYVLYENLPMETRDGREITVEFVSNVYQHGDRNVVQCNVRDVTARKQAEKASIRLAAIVASSDDAIIGTDLDGIIQSWNASAEKIFGYSAGEMVGGSIAPLIPAERLDEENHILEKIKRGESVRHFETVRQAKNGQRIEVSVTVSPIKDSTGKIVGASKVARDITERKRVEEALRQSEERFRAFVTASSDVVYRMSPDWSEMRQLDGRNFIVDTEQPSSTWLQEYIHPDDQPLVMAAINEAIRTKSDFELEHRVRRVDGTLGWTFSRAIPLLDAKGEIVEWFGAASDVTERKHAEDEIRRLNAELEHRVVERTAQLQAANDELDAFSYSVSHDLRTPLRHAMGFVALLQKDLGPSLSGKNLNYLTTIYQAANRMGNLIDDLLAFSRIGKSELQKTEINLDQLVQETVSDFQMDTKERNIVWEIHPLPAVRGDRALLRLVLVNLISNAVKFTSTRPQAKIEIGCLPNAETGNGRDGETGMSADSPSRRLTAKPQGETVIFIRDNGVGFDPQYADKLFGVFQRLHSSEQFEGTGIGLANVRRIILRHGGRVWGTGAVDGGATFSFSLPKQPIGSESG